MKYQAILIAAIVASGAAIAAAPSDSDKTAGSDKAKPAHTAAKHSTQKHHAAPHHAKTNHARTQREATAMSPQTDINDRGRQARIDEALDKYRQQSHS